MEFQLLLEARHTRSVSVDHLVPDKRRRGTSSNV